MASVPSPDPSDALINIGPLVRDMIAPFRSVSESFKFTFDSIESPVFATVMV